MRTAFHTFSPNCTLAGPVPDYIIYLNPMVVVDVRSVASMELGQRTDPSPSTSRSAEALWRSTITSLCLTTRYGRGIQYSPSLTFDAFLRKIRYVWKGRKSWSSFCCSRKVHRWLNKRTDSILVIHPGVSSGSILLSRILNTAVASTAPFSLDTNFGVFSLSRQFRLCVS